MNKQQIGTSMIVFAILMVAIIGFAMHLKTQQIKKELQFKEKVYNLSDNLYESQSNLQSQINLLEQIQENNKKMIDTDIKNLYSKTNYFDVFVKSYDCIHIENNESLEIICK